AEGGGRQPEAPGPLEAGRGGAEPQRRQSAARRARCGAGTGGVALMSPEIGHYALVLGLALALVQSVVPIWGSRKGDAGLMGIAGPVALGQFAFVGLAFAALTHAYLVSDFSVENVVLNSHSTKPLIYKIS